MTVWRCVSATAAGLAGFLCVPAGAAESAGPTVPLGQGTIGSYADLADDGAPKEIGIVLSAGALDGLPAARNATSRCFDANGDGTMQANECEGDYQNVLEAPAAIAGREDIPFQWTMVNWNAEGHEPAAWSVPHFDIHFYIAPREEIEGIRLGSCNFFVDCEDFEKGVVPVAAKYVPADHIDVKAVVGQMGNHLIDSRTPELGDPAVPFTHTWIYGAYDGHIIFQEVMATRDFMAGTGSACGDIKQPEAWERAGYYPTRYCFRRDDADGSLRVYMSDFVLRDAG